MFLNEAQKVAPRTASLCRISGQHPKPAEDFFSWRGPFHMMLEERNLRFKSFAGCIPEVFPFPHRHKHLFHPFCVQIQDSVCNLHFKRSSRALRQNHKVIQRIGSVMNYNGPCCILYKTALCKTKLIGHTALDSLPPLWHLLSISFELAEHIMTHSSRTADEQLGKGYT